jgi:Sulfotransferase family
LPGPASLLSSASLYARSTLKLLERRRRLAPEERLVFVTGCPRSGTTFVAEALGSQPGFLDLGEVHPLKAAIPVLSRLPQAEAARRLRLVLERVRRLGLAQHLRGVEQTPESAHVLSAALAAYPEAKAVHVLRDGRDVVCSLLERGWLSSGRAGADDARLPYGSGARFWVEPDRVAEFELLSDAGRAAWAWRRYVQASRVRPERTIEVRYEEIVNAPVDVARGVASFLHSDPEPLERAFQAAHGRSVGRWRHDLDEGQLADVEREAGELLRELGYS